MTTSGAVFDLAGVGIGPANLSLAALLAPSAELSTVFFDRKKSFEWHPGLMLPDARMQVHFLKDLVTPVDPTNPLSFPAFLVATKRLYRLLVTGRDRISRREFEQYCRWAADRIESLRFGVAVESLEWDGETFLLRTGDGAIRARNVVSGTGLVPRLPDCAAGHDPAVVFHAAHLLEVPRNFTGRRVAVVGGGQSGAEVVYHLLTSPAGPPESILWGTSRSNLLPLDDSPFVDELFLPNFSRYFYGLAEPERRRLIEEQRMASDGVSSGLLETIYRRLYDLELVEDGGRPCRILLGHQLTAIDEAAAGVSTTWRAT
ncbi:MAG TPA: SidA/IucD/PvdA family monooxygenase, partial [Amycolatopsis sp.]|nr:SidA/IucD/PvdA family monooxygenase [Amycolatopsis sp.]